MIEVVGKYNTAKVNTDTADAVTIGQIKNICNQEFTKGSKIRIQADCHGGVGCVVGTTMTITDKVVSNLVGVDIGCGVNLIKLGNIEINLKELDNFINKEIPSGFNNNTKMVANFDEINDLICLKHIPSNNYNLALGSLGGGNHMCEVDKDDKSDKYFIVHTGSRNLGLQVANYYQKVGIDNVKQMFKEDVKIIRKKYSTLEDKTNIESELDIIREKYNIPRELCYLSGKSMDDYLHDIKIVQKYASLNRETICRKVVKKFMRLDYDSLDKIETIHNYIDTDSMILRKGAVSAKLGERLVIPINMRDGCLICIGKGNVDNNCSAPHGAGRLMSRTEAKSKIFMNEFKESMKGIYTTSVGISTIDESPMAYKPMEEIIRNIGDTVEIVDRIKPIYNFKASG